jgi:hypothetical protein
MSAQPGAAPKSPPRVPTTPVSQRPPSASQPSQSLRSSPMIKTPLQQAVKGLRRLLSPSAQQSTPKYLCAEAEEDQPVAPAGEAPGGPRDTEQLSQRWAASRGGPLPFAEWTLDHYMHRPESERAAFWHHPGPARAAMADAIRELPEGHRTRVQADERGWVPEII